MSSPKIEEMEVNMDPNTSPTTNTMYPNTSEATNDMSSSQTEPSPSPRPPQSRIPIRKKPTMLHSNTEQMMQEERAVSSSQGQDRTISSFGAENNHVRSLASTFPRTQAALNSYRRTMPKRATSLAQFADNFHGTDDRMPAVGATGPYSSSTRSSTSSRPVTPDHLTITHEDDAGDTKILTPTGEKVDIPVNENLEIPFDLSTATPLTYKTCRRLSMPLDVDEWSIAVIQQRWYQTIGSKLLVSPKEFKEEADHGSEYLKKWNKVVDPDKSILHRWAVQIMQEVQFQIDEPEKALHLNDEDGSWKFPFAIVPQLIEELPLPLDKRQMYYGQVCVLFDEVAGRVGRELGPCTKHGVIDKECCVAERLLRSTYLPKVYTGIGRLCWAIGIDMKWYFQEVYSRSQLHAIEQDWMDGLEKDRIQEEREEQARIATRKAIMQKHRYSISSGGFPAPPPSPAINPILALKPDKFDWADDDENEWQDNSFIEPPAINPILALKPDKFDWADDDENEWPDNSIEPVVPESSKIPEESCAENVQEQGSKDRSDVQNEEPAGDASPLASGTIASEEDAEDDHVLASDTTVPAKVDEERVLTSDLIAQDDIDEEDCVLDPVAIASANGTTSGGKASDSYMMAGNNKQFDNQIADLEIAVEHAEDTAPAHIAPVGHPVSDSSLARGIEQPFNFQTEDMEGAEDVVPASLVHSEDLVVVGDPRSEAGIEHQSNFTNTKTVVAKTRIPDFVRMFEEPDVNDIEFVRIAQDSEQQTLVQTETLNVSTVTEEPCPTVEVATPGNHTFAEDVGALGVPVEEVNEIPEVQAVGICSSTEGKPSPGPISTLPATQGAVSKTDWRTSLPTTFGFPGRVGLKLEKKWVLTGNPLHDMTVSFYLHRQMQVESDAALESPRDTVDCKVGLVDAGLERSSDALDDELDLDCVDVDAEPERSSDAMDYEFGLVGYVAGAAGGVLKDARRTVFRTASEFGHWLIGLER